MSDPEPSTDRRGFLGWFLGTSLGALTAAVFYPIFRYLSPPHIPEATTNQVEAGTTDDPDLLENGYKIVRFGNEPVILVRASEGDYRAFAATCTHLDCIVEYQPEERRLWCYCHNGGYDLNGKVTIGPPPKALAAYKVDLVAKAVGQPDQIVVSRA